MAAATHVICAGSSWFLYIGAQDGWWAAGWPCRTSRRTFDPPRPVDTRAPRCRRAMGGVLSLPFKQVGSARGRSRLSRVGLAQPASRTPPARPPAAAGPTFAKVVGQFAEAAFKLWPRCPDPGADAGWLCWPGTLGNAAGNQAAHARAGKAPGLPLAWSSGGPTQASGPETKGIAQGRLPHWPLRIQQYNMTTPVYPLQACTLLYWVQKSFK
jgi:hypothetical protein